MVRKLYKKIGDNYWFYPCNESEIKDLLSDNGFKTTKKNILNVVNGIVAYIQEYELDVGAIDTNVVRHGVYD